MLKHLSRMLVVGLLLLTAATVVACGSKSAEPTTTPQDTSQPAAGQTEGQPADDTAGSAATTPTSDVTELKIEDVKNGTGAEAASGKKVTVHYTLWLTDGTKIESSKDSGQPYTFVLGSGSVIPGWDQGIPGMKVGGVRKLTIPPALAYGASGNGPVPPNATLVFEVELLGVN